MDPVISLRGLEKRYRSVVALAGVDLDVGAGEIFGLIGPNGAGKTTLIRSVVGALRPTSGTVRVLGLDPLGDRWRLRSLIGYMPQLPALYPDLSARRNVAFFAAAHRLGGDGVDVEEALELVDLTFRADDAVHTLSGGMQQRLSLACALVHRPGLLILDEPTAGVDPELRASFWDRFRAMAAAGTTLVVSTHQMNEALLCDRVALMRSGRIVAADDPARLFRSNRARVRVWRGSEMREEIVEDYSAALPRLAMGASRVEVEPEPIDEVVLRLIRDAQP